MSADATTQRRDRAVRSGLSLGHVLAVAISWSLHQSILWAVLHGLFGWFYVAYFAIWGRV